MPVERVRTLAFVGVLLGAMVTSVVNADVVTLKNGNDIRGRIVAETPDQIVVELPYGLVTIDRDEVEKLTRESEEATLRGTAESLLRHKDYERSIHFLELAFEKSQDDATRSRLLDAYDHAIRAEIEASRYGAARQKLKRAEARLGDEEARLQAIVGDLRRAGERLETLEVHVAEARSDNDLEDLFDNIQTLCSEFPEERLKWTKPLADVAVALGHRAMNAEEIEKAREFYHVALAAEPDVIAVCRIPLAYAEIDVARKLIKEGALEKAAEGLEDAYSAVPGETAITYYLALAYEGLGRIDEAGNLYRAIANGSGSVGSGKGHVVDLRRSAEQAIAKAKGIDVDEEPVSERDRRAGRLETKHFILVHENAPLARAIGRLLETRLTALSKRWFRGQAVLDKKIRVVLHASRSSFLADGTIPEWSDGVTRNGRKLGRILEQELHFDTTAAQFESAVVPHELAHVALPHLLGLGAQVPIWIEEGIATDEEPEFKQRHYRKRVSDALAMGTLIPLRELFATQRYPSSEARVELFYAQSHAVIEYMKSRIGLRETLDLAAAMTKRSADEVLRERTRWVNAGALEVEWRKQLAAKP